MRINRQVALGASLRFSRVFPLVAVAAFLAACGDDDTGPSNAAPTAAFAAKCNPLDCIFTNSSTDTDGTLDSYDWNFGDDSPHITTRDAIHTYFAPRGRFSVTLNVTDDGGETATTSREVDAPGAFPPVPASALTYVRVAERNRGTVSRYVLYEDGTFALQQVTGAFYETTGTYVRVNASISLYFDANQPQWQATATIQGDSLVVDYSPMMELDDFEDGVYQLAAMPTAAFTATCSGLECTFIDESIGEGLIWEWQFGDGAQSQDQSPTHVYEVTETTTFTVTLVVLDGNLAEDVVSHEITVVAPE